MGVFPSEFKVHGGALHAACRPGMDAALL